MKNPLIIFAFLLSGYAGFCQEKNAGPSELTKKSAVKKSQKHTTERIKVYYGMASFYSNKFEGRRTANGDIFSQKKLTAASNIIRLNEWVRVTNVHNRKSVIVRITDRMHRNNKRLIDLSRSAAKKLHYTGNGLASVKVEDLGRNKPADYMDE